MWSHLHSRLFLHRWKSLDSIREVIQRSHSTCQISNMHDEGPRPVNATCGDVVFWPADGSVFLIIIRPLVHQAVFVWAQTLHTQTNTPVSCNRAAPPGCPWLGDPFVMGEEWWSRSQSGTWPRALPHSPASACHNLRHPPPRPPSQKYWGWEFTAAIRLMRFSTHAAHTMQFHLLTCPLCVAKTSVFYTFKLSLIWLSWLFDILQLL